MAMKPVPSWGSDYGKKFEDAFSSAADGGPDESTKVWGKWVNENATGIEVAPPYKSMGSGSDSNFGPVIFPPVGTPVDSALILATAWQKWYLSLSFPPSPPSPPFLSIASIVPSPVGVPIAFAALFSGLVAEMAVVPPEPNTAFQLKGISYGTLFYTACLSAGVQISGLAPGAPPVPLILPLIPVL